MSGLQSQPLALVQDLVLHIWEGVRHLREQFKIWIYKMSKRPKVAAHDEETKQVVPSQKPKKPLSAYMLFTMDRRAALKAAKSEISGKDILKEMGKEWRVLDQSKKTLYESKAELLKTQYKENLEAYEKRHHESQPIKAQRKPKGGAESGGKRKKPVRS
jgi:hypothetical protein